MTKFILTLEIEARPFTEKEAAEEAEMTGMEVEDFIGEVDIYEVGDCLAGYLDDGAEEAFAGSNCMAKVVSVKMASASLRSNPDD